MYRQEDKKTYTYSNRGKSNQGRIIKETFGGNMTRKEIWRKLDMYRAKLRPKIETLYNNTATHRKKTPIGTYKGKQKDIKCPYIAKG